MRKARNEIKYLCTEQELSILESRIKNVCHADAHAREDGSYTVRSLYFDDYWNSCYFDNENGTDMREKYRIRIYDGNMQKFFLECKRKVSDISYKTSCPLPITLCNSILDENRYWKLQNYSSDSMNEQERMLLRKFYLSYRTRLLVPKIIVEYERTPYINEHGNVRITFDRYIGFSNKISDFKEQSIFKRPILSCGKHILEIKFDEYLPDYIHGLFEDMNLQRTAFSKYYYCRKFSCE